MQPLGEPDDQGERWKNEQHDRQSEREIDRPLDPAIERIFERFLPQADEMKTIVLEMYHWMAQLFLQVADDQESHPELVAGGDEVAVQFGELRELEHDHLGHSMFLDRTAEAVRPAEDRNLALRPIEEVHRK